MTRSDDLLVDAEHPGLAQHGVDEGGLAVVDVGDDGDVAQVGARVVSERWRAFRVGADGAAHREQGLPGTPFAEVGKWCTLTIHPSARPNQGRRTMYLFTRSRRIDPGEFAKGDGVGRSRSPTTPARSPGQQIDAWTAVMSPEIGTVVWTLWAETMAQVVQAGDAARRPTPGS